MSLVANFKKDTVDVTLTGLATLTGDIDGSEFSGDEATVLTNAYGVDDRKRLRRLVGGRVLRGRCGGGRRCLRLRLEGQQGRRVQRRVRREGHQQLGVHSPG